MALSPSDIKGGVDILLLPKNIEFLEKIHRIVAGDPQYLFFHASSCGQDIRRILWEDGLYVSDESDAITILQEALRRYTKSHAA